ncbi:MAG: GNAT family N-acetyltransferase [Faecalibacterium sp.]
MPEEQMQEPSFVYMLRCARGDLYTGWTNDPAARIHAHKKGVGAKYTRGFKAKRFAYLEQCSTKSAGLQREAAIKKLKKAEKETLCSAWAAAQRPSITLGTLADTADILALYQWYVLNHTATYQITPPTLPEYQAWVRETLERSPILLARNASGKLLGFACGHLYRPREAYAWDIETTIYCDRDARGLGVGDLLYPPLLDIMERNGYYTAYAILSDPNPASEAFHIRQGFHLEGRSPRAGFKFGKWQGTSKWALQLKKGKGTPAPVKMIAQEEMQAVLEKYEALRTD